VVALVSAQLELLLQLVPIHIQMILAPFLLLPPAGQPCLVHFMSHHVQLLVFPPDWARHRFRGRVEQFQGLLELDLPRVDGTLVVLSAKWVCWVAHTCALTDTLRRVTPAVAWPSCAALLVQPDCLEGFVTRVVSTLVLPITATASIVGGHVPLVSLRE